MTTGFVALVQSAFDFLAKEYGFEISHVSEDRSRPFYGESVALESAQTVFAVGVDRGVLWAPTIGRTIDKEQFGSTAEVRIDRIYEYKLIPREIRTKLASQDPRQLKRTFAEHMKSARLDLREFGYIDSDSQSMESRVKVTLEAYSQVVQQFADPYLRGDFSTWLELCEYRLHWLIASEFAHGRAWGEELTFKNVEARFSKLGNYIEHLRREQA